jgi:hypothetical protein
VQLTRLAGILADLRRIRKRFEKELEGVGQLRIAPHNDAEGDCGVGVLFRFDHEAGAVAFAQALGPNCGYHCIDHNKHVYTNWTPLRQRLASHHPDLNPFNFPKNQGLRTDYSEQACPRTLELLRRSYVYQIKPDWTESEIAHRISTCQKAAQ